MYSQGSEEDTPRGLLLHRLLCLRVPALVCLKCHQRLCVFSGFRGGDTRASLGTTFWKSQSLQIETPAY